MFILRRVLNDTFISNILIGNKYSLCFKSEFLDDFNKIVESRKLHDIKDKIFAFVINENEEYPLYINSRYYIMTSDGNTFEKIKKH